MIEKLQYAKLIEGSDRYYATPDGKIYSVAEITPIDNGNGYKTVQLELNGKRGKFYVHRLIAKMFIPNPKNYATVDHIDGDKSHNYQSNLQWLTHVQNIRKYFKGDYALISPSGDLVKFQHIRKFSQEYNLDPSTVVKLMKGKVKTHKGWRPSE